MDRQYRKYVSEEMNVQDPELIFQMEYDYIFLAVKDSSQQAEIRERLLNGGVCAEKIKCFCEE